MTTASVSEEEEEEEEEERDLSTQTLCQCTRARVCVLFFFAMDHTAVASSNYMVCDMDQANASTNAVVNGVTSGGAVYSQAPTTLKQGSPPVYDNNNQQEQVNANMPHASAFGMIETSASEVLYNSFSLFPGL